MYVLGCDLIIISIIKCQFFSPFQGYQTQTNLVNFVNVKKSYSKYKEPSPLMNKSIIDKSSENIREATK